MDFFRAQHNARYRTRLLVELFLLSLICLLTMANLILYFAFGNESDPLFYVAISAAILLIVLCGSLFKSISLRQGGEAVAQMLNARLLAAPSTQAEQRLLNVVEEMAIASGTPVPPVYVMEEVAINAFAAGHSINDAVIGITRGAIESLNRDELQGVIAHEFSHILHGDMRLNLRLISWLHGIMVLGIMGHYILRAAPAARRNNNSNSNAGVALFGLGLIVLGASGSFFGGLIKAAVSRQREYLADASAVQYTRNPQGIAGALKRIAVDTNNQVLTNAATSQISHSLFSEGVHVSFSSLFATHPALDKRIRAIDPDWDGEYQSNTLETQPSKSAASPSQGPEQAHKISVPLAIALAIARAGAPDDQDVSDAQALHRSLPTACAQAAHNPLGAASVIAVLLMQQELSQSVGASAQQLQDLLSLRLPAEVGSELRAEIIRILPDVLTIDDAHRLPLTNVCLGTLRQLSLAQYQGYRRVLQHIVDSDSSPDLRSWVLFQLTTLHLDKTKGLIAPTLLSARTTLAQSVKSLEIFFSLLSHCGHHNAEQTEAAFKAAANDINMPDLTLIALTALGLLDFQQATKQLTTLVDTDKQRLLNAMSVCIYYDEKLTAAENELMKMTSELLDWPLPANIFRPN